MPELPEVESTVNFLRSRTLNKQIKKITVNWPRLIAKPSVDFFKEKLLGSRIVALERRGKYIKFVLKKNNKRHFLFGHMRMSGSFDVVSSSVPDSKHDHVKFTLNNNKEIRFHDPRKFGRFTLVDDEEEVSSKLGFEPLSNEISANDFYQKLSVYNRSIKIVLLDQSVIAGVGNIYADESLWAAKIHPLSKANVISIKFYNALYKNLRKILDEAINANGTDFGDGVVESGMYVPRVYGRAKLNCKRCKSPLTRIVVAQRGTTFCSKCQIFTKK
jgi:formamidopyrimidine-DNA glycosylase